MKAINEECAWADIVIAQDPVSECAADYVIDRFDTYENGAYAIYLNSPLKIVHVLDHARNRPWMAYAQNRQY